MQCPGQDSRYWTGSAVFETACEKCGHPLEFFKDDSTRVCNNCGHRMLNPKIDFGCASYCPYASQCLGELPPELLKKKQEELVEQVAVAIKQRLGQDFKAIGHAGRVARRAGELAHNREGTNPAVLNIAAYLHTLYPGRKLPPKPSGYRRSAPCWPGLTPTPAWPMRFAPPSAISTRPKPRRATPTF